MTEGNEGENIILTGASQNPGSWKYIKFFESSADSILNYVSVNYGGKWNPGREIYGAVRIENNSILIKNSVIEDNIIGIDLINSDFATGTEEVIVRNNNIGIYIEGECPSLNGLIIEDNTSNNIWPDKCKN